MPDGDHVTVAGIRVTHPERVLYGELGLTKAALARYYESVAEWMMPELRERPLSLVRCPSGPGEGCFYQKNIDANFPAEIGRVPVELGGGGVYAAANSIAAVVGLVQMGVIELHSWGATTRDLERPDRMVLDLDPDPRLPWRVVMAAAHRTRERLESLGLESFVKTTGGKGCTWWCRSRAATTGTR
jgi:bifunctional non-homologous end joining protein LigD